MPSPVDLHTHTTASDGRFSPAELLAEAVRLGVRYLAISDHDTTAGFDAALALPPEPNAPEIIPAIEMSAEGELACHILGYWIDSKDPDFQQRLHRQREQRVARMRAMVDRLNRLGLEVRLERVLELSRGGTVGRPHLADALVERGFVRSRGEAFDRYLSNRGPVYVAAQSPTAQEVIDLVRGAGGIPVLAHPAFHSEEALIKNLAKLGIMGIEVYYPEHGRALTQKYRDLARELGLLVTGGSDFHGPKTGRAALACVDVPLDVVDALRNARRRN